MGRVNETDLRWSCNLSAKGIVSMIVEEGVEEGVGKRREKTGEKVGE